jgi:Ca2+-binding EF-hand superfamily protein
MSKTYWMLGVGAVAFGLAVLPAGARAQQAGAQKDIPGPIDSLQDLEDTGRMLFKLADENDDNQISQKEAIDAGNLLVGGFFFRADKNGDGTLSQAEAREARDDFFKDHPWAKYIAETVKAESKKEGQGKSNQVNSAENALESVAAAFDTNNDKQLQATELRQAVQTTVQGLFASADTNRDGQLSPTEVNAALAGGVRAVSQAAFQNADTDHDGTISEAEFDQALRQPVHVLFAIADLNHDGKLSQDEMQRLRRTVISRIASLRVPEPRNSLGNMIRSGRSPSELAPVPTFGTPTNQPNTAPAPAQPR